MPKKIIKNKLLEEKAKKHYSSLKSMMIGFGFSLSAGILIVSLVLVVSVLGMPFLLKFSKGFFDIPGKSANVLKPVALEEKTFKDVVDLDVDFAIESMLKAKLINKNYERKFRPDDLMSRAELMKIFGVGKSLYRSRLSYLKCFKDVSTEWFAPNICLAKSRGWISSDQDFFFPNNAVTVGFLFENFQKLYPQNKFLKQFNSEINFVDFAMILKQNGCDNSCSRFRDFDLDDQLTRADVALIYFYLLRADSTALDRSL